MALFSARTPLAMMLIAASVMVFEIALIRIFSFRIWHHFASMVLSIALLGFTLSGVLLHWRPALGQPTERRAAAYSTQFALASVLAVWLASHLPLDPTRLAQEPRQVAYLVGYYLVFLAPFTFAGLAIVTLLSGARASLSRLYAFDLVGAGVGCYIAVVLLGWFGAEGTIVGCAAMAVTASALLASGDSELELWKRYLAAALIVVVAIPLVDKVWSTPVGESKALHVVTDKKQFPESRIAFQDSNALFRVDVVEKTAAVVWTQNPRGPHPLGGWTQILIDGDAATPIVPFKGDFRQVDYLDWSLSTAAAGVMKPKRALVIGAGGGVDVLGNLYRGAEHVTAVEINDLVIDLGRNRYRKLNGGLFARSDVSLHSGEGRSFVGRSEEKYDLIQLSLVDTWAASASGAHTLAEAYLYTENALEDYLRHLNPDGVVTIGRWLLDPPRESLRLVVVAVAALERLGVEQPRRHIVVLKLAQTAAIIVKRTPFTRVELDGFQAHNLQKGFTFLYAGGVPINPPTTFMAYLDARDRAAFVDAYRFDVTSVDDDRPFFFQFGRWKDVNPFGGAWSGTQDMLSGKLVLLTNLVQAFVLSMLLLVVAYFRRQPRVETDLEGVSKPRRLQRGALIHFGALGVAFMLVEVAMIQHLILYLGHPMYSITVVLAVLLVSAGVGSRLSDRLIPRGRPLAPLYGVVMLLAVLSGVALPSLLNATLGWSLSARIVVAGLSVAGLGVPLGMPFPAALQRVRDYSGDEKLIGWAWAANGAGSVIGPVLAPLIALDFGYRNVWLVGAMLYGVAWVSARLFLESPPEQPAQPAA